MLTYRGFGRGRADHRYASPHFAERPAQADGVASSGLVVSPAVAAYAGALVATLQSEVKYRIPVLTRCQIARRTRDAENRSGAFRPRSIRSRGAMGAPVSSNSFNRNFSTRASSSLLTPNSLTRVVKRASVASVVRLQTSCDRVEMTPPTRASQRLETPRAMSMATRAIEC